MSKYLDPRFMPAAEDDARNEDAVVYGFDRLTLWLDRSELPCSLPVLKQHCANIVVALKQMKKQPRWKLEIQLYQPTAKCLRLLAKGLGLDVAVTLTYSEIACDLQTGSKGHADRWRNDFMASALMRHQRQGVALYEGTCYFGRRTDGEKRRSNVLAVYADKPSKLNNARPSSENSPCLHIEWRATGSGTLERLGIVTLDDLIQFDHQRFWDRHVLLFRLPKPTTLGRILASAAGDDPDVSGSALRKRAARWKVKYTLGSDQKIFAMHSALRDTESVRKHFDRVAFSEWVSATVCSQAIR